MQRYPVYYMKDDAVRFGPSLSEMSAVQNYVSPNSVRKWRETANEQLADIKRDIASLPDRPSNPGKFSYKFYWWVISCDSYNGVLEKKQTTVILIFCILAKNGEKVIYTAHGLLAVTSNSGVFSLHQFILFFAFFRCVNILFAPMMLETKYIGDNFEILCPLYGTNIDAVWSPRCAINIDLGFYPLCNQFDCSEWSFFLWSISRINFF